MPILPLGELSNDQDDEIGMVSPLGYFAIGENYPMIRMMESEWFPLLTILPVGGTIFSHIGLCPNHIDSFEIFNFIFGVDAGVILCQVARGNVPLGAQQRLYMDVWLFVAQDAVGY